MLISTMTYDDIYCEIKNDSRELFVAIEKQLPDFRKYAKRAKGAYGRIYQWRHTVSQNVYTYFFHIKRHSDWDKTPRLIIFTEYNNSIGKMTLTVMRDPDGNIRIGFFKPHFFERYEERNLTKLEGLKVTSKRDIKMAFLLRTSTTMSLGDKMASLKELEKEEPDFVNDALLTPEGLIQCKIYKKNPNIVLFKTYLSIQDLYQKQYEEVLQNAIHIFYLRALNDSPRFQKSIETLYYSGINELNRLLFDPSLPKEEKQEIRIKRYGEIINDFYEYII
ncbi:MAG: hypothetical protein IKP93_00155 [Paludibacteraceae bacterium]|nr:hypothetical protein [Paludibacteraceae bacterium]